MKFQIRHETTYRYRDAVGLQPHRLMLVPRSSHDLKVLASSIRLTPEAEIEWTQDVFGNMVATACFLGSADQLVISTDVTVEQFASAWPIFRIAPGAHSYPFTYSEEERADLGALLKAQHPDNGGRFDNWVRAFVHACPTDTLSLLKDINNGIADAIAYRTRDEDGTQGPLETL